MTIPHETFSLERAMQLGLGVLKLSPRAFWAMTPRELAQAITGVRGPVATPMDRGALDVLMQKFPDHKENARE